MKKYCRVWIFAMVLLLCLPLFCACDIDRYEGRRPTDQPNTKWVCTEYDISFEVSDEGLAENGVFEINGKSYEFDLLWSAVQNGYIPDVIVFDPDKTEGDSTLFSGFCKFSKKYFEIEVTHDPQGFFPEDSTLRFERVE